MSDEILLRRKAAGEYLKGKYGFGSASTLSHLVGDPDGPKYYSAGPRVIVYRQSDLDAWANSQLVPGAPKPAPEPRADTAPRRGRPRKDADPAAMRA